jgi:hypothetical protein
MSNVVKFPVAIRLNLKALSDSVQVDAPRGIDYAMAAERQVWRILSSGQDNSDKSYQLALMMAKGNVEDAIRHLEAMRDALGAILAEFV